MDNQQVYAFWLFAFVAAVTPGPSNALLLTAGVRGGFVGGLPCLVGVVAGMSSMMAAAGLGLAGLVHRWPLLLLVLKLSGAALLLHLAWRVAHAPPATGVRGEKVVGFWRALAFQWVNPKSWIVSLSAASTYGVGYSSNQVAVAVMLASVFAAAAAPSCLFWLACGVKLQRVLAEPARSVRFNRVMAALLVASVVLVLR
jgi:threonine/homoserine/homoserine lactone efflux protein